MKIKAIDISYAQPEVDFEKVKQSKIKTVIIRNGYLGTTDTHFKKHMDAAIKAGFDIGTYTYIMADTVAEARTEARETLKRLEPYKGHVNYPVFCDMESAKYYDKTKYSNRLRTDIIKTFCEVIEAGGYYPAIYINPAWLEQWTNKDELLDKYDIWLAAWTESEAKATKYDYGQAMWQWGTKRVGGIKDAVDSNLVYVDFPKKIKQAGKNYLPEGDVQRAAAHDIYYSYGMAAIRSCYGKQYSAISRCEKGKLYPIDGVIEVNGETWLSHANGTGYSMLKDGPLLFKAKGAYQLYTATTNVNARTAPKVANSTFLAVIKKGEDVYVVSENENGWYTVVYDGIQAYVSAQYLKEK